MNSEMLWNMLECHKVPRLPRETKLRDAWNLQKEPLLQNSPIGTAALTRTVANGCGRLRNLWQTQPQSPSPHGRVKREPLLRSRELEMMTQMTTNNTFDPLKNAQNRPASIQLGSPEDGTKVSTWLRKFVRETKANIVIAIRGIAIFTSNPKARKPILQQKRVAKLVCVVPFVPWNVNINKQPCAFTSPLQM